MKFEWQPSDINISKITEAQAKFIFEQGEKLLKDIADTNSLIVARTTTLVTISVGFMLALIGFLFKRYSAVHDIFDDQVLTCLFTQLYIFSLCRILVQNIQGQNYHVTGAEPKKLFIDPFFNEDLMDENRVDDSDRMKMFYVNEIVVCQNKIKINMETNNKRWKLFNKSLWRLLYTPIVIICIYVAVKTVKTLFVASAFCCI